MLDKFKARNFEEDGNPAGGHVRGCGLTINWQDGPLRIRKSDVRTPIPNGAFVETVIAAARQRLEFYQTASGGRFGCIENAEAIAHLRYALKALDKRTKGREARGVEGTHEQ